MFKNIGKKIKMLAIITFLVEAISAVVGGIIMASSHKSMVAWGFLVIIVGPIVAWVSSFILYGFGELIDQTCDIKNALYKEVKREPYNVSSEQKKAFNEYAYGSRQSAPSFTAQQKTNQAYDLYMKGLITREEYEQISGGI